MVASGAPFRSRMRTTRVSSEPVVTGGLARGFGGWTVLRAWVQVLHWIEQRVQQLQLAYQGRVDGGTEAPKEKPEKKTERGKKQNTDKTKKSKEARRKTVCMCLWTSLTIDCVPRPARGRNNRVTRMGVPSPHQCLYGPRGKHAGDCGHPTTGGCRCSRVSGFALTADRRALPFLEEDQPDTQRCLSTPPATG